jgi:hypothetical protein
MRKNLFIILLSFVALVFINILFFHSFYKLQIKQQKNLLFKQTEVCSDQIEQTIQKFESDLNYIVFSDEIPGIFVNGENSEGLRKLELFYSSYHNLIKNIDIYDNNKNVMNIFRDRKKNFITDSYVAQRQKTLSDKEEVLIEENDYQYVLPVFTDNKLDANILITINLNNYILSELERFHLKDITWQWVVDLEHNKIYNSEGINYSTFIGLDEMNKNLSKDFEGMLVHHIKNDSIDNKLLTVYSPIKVLNKDFGIAMSVDYSIFLKQIFSELAIISSISILLFLVVSLFLLYQIKILKKKINL